MTMDDAVKLFSRDTDLLLEKDALFCYGMSKMHIGADTKQKTEHLKVINITEFAEMCGRVAEFRCKNDPDSFDMDIIEKLEVVFDKILATVGLQTILPDGDGAMEESMSDEDY